MFCLPCWWAFVFTSQEEGSESWISTGSWSYWSSNVANYFVDEGKLLETGISSCLGYASADFGKSTNRSDFLLSSLILSSSGVQPFPVLWSKFARFELSCSFWLYGWSKFGLTASCFPSPEIVENNDVAMLIDDLAYVM